VNVVDSSIIAKYILREEGWEQVRKYLEEGALTFKIAIKEALNALWKRVVMKEIESNYAFQVAKILLKHPIVKFEPQDPYLPDAFRIATARKITVYDALFIALAKRHNSKLITSDRKQADVAEIENVEVIYIP